MPPTCLTDFYSSWHDLLVCHDSFSCRVWGVIKDIKTLFMVSCLTLTIWQLPAMIYNKKQDFFFSTLCLMADLFFSFLRFVYFWKNPFKNTAVQQYYFEAVKPTTLNKFKIMGKSERTYWLGMIKGKKCWLSLIHSFEHKVLLGLSQILELNAVFWKVKISNVFVFKKTQLELKLFGTLV